MTLHIIGSGSKGNGYLLKALDGETLMLEAGVPFKSVLRALGGNTKKVAGCLVTHEHGDHAKHVKDVLGYGIRTYMTQGTARVLAFRNPGWENMIHTVDTDQQYQVGSFIIRPFDTVHDAEQPCGFLIWHQEMGNLLFATDTRYIPYTFENLSNIMIEANFDRGMLDAREDIPESLKERIAANHMSIDSTLWSLGQQDLSQVNNIVLIHMSEHDGEPQAFMYKVLDNFGKTVTVAERGLIITFNKTPF